MCEGTRLSSLFLLVQHISRRTSCCSLCLDNCSSCSCQHGEINRTKQRFPLSSLQHCTPHWQRQRWQASSSVYILLFIELGWITENNLQVLLKTKKKGIKSWIINNFTSEDVINSTYGNNLALTWASERSHPSVSCSLTPFTSVNVPLQGQRSTVSGISVTPRPCELSGNRASAPYEPGSQD